MKKLTLLLLLCYFTSCSNPEDNATGNPDSTSFNQSGNEKNLNTGSSNVGNQSESSNNDTMNSSTDKENINSTTQGTNRSYNSGGDTAKKH